MIEPQKGKPDRKVYTVTQKGNEAMEKALIEASPKITPLHSIRTIMLNMRNLEYFERLADQLKLAIDATTAEMKRTESPIEKLAMKRENFLHYGELEFCAEAINFLTQTNVQKSVA